MSALPCMGRGCDAMVEQTPRAQRRKWCSERCRKQTLYTGTCIDCGEPTGWNGTATPSERCHRCAMALIVESGTRKVWTPQAIVRAIHEWAVEYGESPAGPDWMPTKARSMGDEARALRFENAGGRWPHVATVVRAFGTWNNALRAAGYEIRPAHGGCGNSTRRRSVRERAAA